MPPSPHYRAEEGMEDRDGEMTGAISINMVLSMPAVAIWAMFLAPLIFDTLTPILISSLLLAVVLPLACFRLSRRIWSRISAYMDQADDPHRQ